MTDNEQIRLKAQCIRLVLFPLKKANSVSFGLLARSPSFRTAKTLAKLVALLLTLGISKLRVMLVSAQWLMNRISSDQELPGGVLSVSGTLRRR